MTSKPWIPVLDGQLAERALDALESIAAYSVGLTPPPTDDNDPAVSIAEAASLARGHAGIALLYAYLSQIRQLDDERRSRELLEAASLALEDVRMSSSLYEGFTGIAWAHTHVTRLFGADDEDPNQAVDEALTEYLSQTPWNDDHDLISGLVGLGVYALDERPRPRADSMLRLVLDRLGELAEPCGGEVTWHTPPTLLFGEQRAEFPNGFYNLGVAHGVPGVVALLGEACAAGFGATVGTLLERAVAWLLKQQLDARQHGLFPSMVGPGVVAQPARLAWCYGDTGVATALLVAARGAGRQDWEREALRVARRAAGRAVEQSAVRDGGLCHGAAGLGHIFNRLYHATSEPWLADAARAWFARTLDMRRPGEGVAGFSALGASPDGRDHWHADQGFLTGTAGIGLALLSACTSIEPAWDRVLLTSIPH